MKGRRYEETTTAGGKESTTSKNEKSVAHGCLTITGRFGASIEESGAA
jgi:hypothetical protein